MQEKNAFKTGITLPSLSTDGSLGYDAQGATFRDIGIGTHKSSSPTWTDGVVTLHHHSKELYVKLVVPNSVVIFSSLFCECLSYSFDA